MSMDCMYAGYNIMYELNACVLVPAQEVTRRGCVHAHAVRRACVHACMLI